MLWQFIKLVWYQTFLCLFSFIHFQSEEEVDKAAQMYNDYDFKGSRLRVQGSNLGGSRSVLMKTLAKISYFHIIGLFYKGIFLHRSLSYSK